jgi:hypothetical protein
MAIQPGDIVEPRCGGPPMKVRFTSTKFALCSWADLSLGKRRIDLFRLDALVLLEQSAPRPPTNEDDEAES